MIIKLFGEKKKKKQAERISKTNFHLNNIYSVTLTITINSPKQIPTWGKATKDIKMLIKNKNKKQIVLFTKTVAWPAEQT